MKLVLGASANLDVREERVELGLGVATRLAYASDLHIGLPWTRNMDDLLVAALERAQVSTLVLGGDLVERGAGASELERVVARLSRLTTVAAVPGNHDRGALERVRAAVLHGGGLWLPDEPLLLARGRLRLVGALTQHERSGAAIDVLCAHEPDIFPKAVGASIPLVLAGHLHGCQVVAFEASGKLYPGAWFYRWNGRRFARDGATLLVSTGCADSWPLRWNCPRELLVCALS